MDKDVYRQTRKRISEIEREFGSLENFALQTTNLSDQHRMRLEEESFSSYAEMMHIFEELQDLEIADLLDYQNMAGLFDGEFD